MKVKRKFHFSNSYKFLIRLSQLFAPSFLIPFSLVTPLVFFNSVGITIFELLTIIGFISIILKRRQIPKENIIVIYITLLFLGYITSSINGFLSFGIPLSPGDLKVGYWIILAMSGYCVGKNYFQKIETIASSRVFKFIIFSISTFIVSYPFLSTDLKYSIMVNFYGANLSSWELRRIDSPRFPGLGINSNIYAFMLLLCFHIYTYSAFKGVVSWKYAVLLFFAICICASKTVLTLALFLFFVMLFLITNLKLRKRLKYLVIVVVLLLSAIYFLNFTSIGNEIRNNLVVIDRFISLTEDRSDFGYENSFSGRTSLWSTGMERVKLSPFLGIKLSGKSDDDNILDFCCPHNEFIAYWTFMGILGLAAYFVLIFNLILRNRFSHNAVFWYLLYFALIIQMFFDSAFQTVRFIPLFFILVGINLNELKINKLI